MGVERVDAKPQSAGLIAQATARLQRMEIVLLRHLCLSTVVVGVEDGGHRTVLVQRCISGTV